MSKRTTTQWYIGAWSVAALFVIAGGATARVSSTGSPLWLFGALGLLLVGCGLVMLVMWVGALVQLAHQQAWGWFAAVLVLHLIFLGVVGMIAYAIAGPEDAEPVAIRPTAM